MRSREFWRNNLPRLGLWVVIKNNQPLRSLVYTRVLEKQERDLPWTVFHCHVLLKQGSCNNYKSETNQLRQGQDLEGRRLGGYWPVLCCLRFLVREEQPTNSVNAYQCARFCCWWVCSGEILGVASALRSLVYTRALSPELACVAYVHHIIG